MFDTLKKAIWSFAQIFGFGLGGGLFALQAAGAEVNQSVSSDTPIDEISLLEGSAKSNLHTMVATVVTPKVTDRAMATVKAAAAQGKAAFEGSQIAITHLVPARAQHFLEAQPNLAELLTWTNNDALDITITPYEAALDIPSAGTQSPSGHPQESLSTINGPDNGNFLSAIAKHFDPTPNSVVGMMLQVDSLTQVGDQAILPGSGYFLAPYFAERVHNLWGATKPLQVQNSEALLAGGVTDNGGFVGTITPEDYGRFASPRLSVPYETESGVIPNNSDKHHGLLTVHYQSFGF